MKTFHALVFALLMWTAQAQAQTTTATPILITALATGWGADAFRIVTNVAIVNPANCATPDGYVSELAQPGYKTNLTVASLAYAMGKRDSIVVHNTACAHSRPVILGLVTE